MEATPSINDGIPATDDKEIQSTNSLNDIDHTNTHHTREQAIIQVHTRLHGNP